MSVRKVVVAIDQDGRLEAAQKLCVDHGMELFIDEEMKSCTEGWIAALEKGLEGLPPTGSLMMLSDDSELSHDFDEFSQDFAFVVASTGGFGDLQANHCLAKAALDSGIGLYTTPDGCTAFGVTATAAVWRAWLDSELVQKRGLHGLVFDEMINAWSMMNRREILKPTMSAVEHRLEFRSTTGNEDQPVEMRRSAHFDPAHPHNLGERVAHLGRSYNANHWRFLWDLRRNSLSRNSLMMEVYAVERNAPSKDFRESPLALTWQV